jgi:Ras-related C3 botulinum toxin substrate 1
LEELAKDSVKIFVGNKIDLRDENLGEGNKGPVQKETARKMIEDLGCKYVECSALTQDGLKEVFDEAIRAALHMKMPKMKAKKPKDAKNCNLI